MKTHDVFQLARALSPDMRSALRSAADRTVNEHAPAQGPRGTFDTLHNWGLVAWAKPPLGQFAYATPLGVRVAHARAALDGRSTLELRNITPPPR